MLKTIIHGQMQTKLHIEMLKDTKGIPQDVELSGWGSLAAVEMDKSTGKI